MNEGRLSLYILVAAETFHSGSQFMPGLDDLRDSTFDDKVTTVRRGEVICSAWSLVVALLIAHAINSPAPLAIWLGTSVFIMGVYEYHLREAPRAS